MQWKTVEKVGLRKSSRESLLKRVKAESDQKKLILNITFYPVFQNERNILQEVHILFAPDQEDKKVLQDIPPVWFRDCKSSKDYLVRANLSNVETTEKSKSFARGNFQIHDFICDTDAFPFKACGKTFKIQTGTLNCNSEKVVYFLECRTCEEAAYDAIVKKKFRARFNNFESGQRCYRKKTENITAAFSWTLSAA